MYAHAGPSSGLSLPYSGTTSAASDAFSVGNTGTGVAIRGIADSTFGVVGWTGSSDESGVYGYSPHGIGVKGRAEGDNHGVVGVSLSTNPMYAGVRGLAQGAGPGVSAHGPALGLHATTGFGGLAGLFDGDVQTSGRFSAVTTSGAAGTFISDTLTASDSGVVHARYNGPPGGGDLPAAICGISRTTDGNGIGGYFEAGFCGTKTVVTGGSTPAYRMGHLVQVDGGTGSKSAYGVVVGADGAGNYNNYGLWSHGSGGNENWGVFAAAACTVDSKGFPAIRNTGGSLRAYGADTAIGVYALGWGSDTVSYGVFAEASGSRDSYGGYFDATGDSSVYGLWARAFGGNANTGIIVEADTGTWDVAGSFWGDVWIWGNLAATTKSFRIDHPFDPENKYLMHSCVESPEMLNVYNGNITTDYQGYATVELAEYFSAINTDFRYQLTVIGTFAQAIVADEISGNSFVIRTSEPNVKVSWQVTGVRNDAAAQMHRTPVEVDKPDWERGTYLNPEAYGLGPEYGARYRYQKRAPGRDAHAPRAWERSRPE